MINPTTKGSFKYWRLFEIESRKGLCMISIFMYQIDQKEGDKQKSVNY
jgi:hypothetical protein